MRGAIISIDSRTVIVLIPLCPCRQSSAKAGKVPDKAVATQRSNHSSRKKLEWPNAPVHVLTALRD